MHIGFKITLGVLGAGTLFGIGYAIHRSIRSKKEDDLTVDIGTVDWANRKVPYIIKANGKTEISGITPWRSDLVGKGEVNGGGNQRNTFGEIHLTNGLVIYAKSLGSDKDAKIVDFVSKTVKPYKGNASNAIAAAGQTLTNLFG